MNINFFQSILFDTNGPLLGITHTLGTAGIRVTNAGVYTINFSVSGVESNQFTIFIEGAPAPSTVYSSGAGTQPNGGIAIITLAAGAVLTLVNHTFAAAVNLQTLAGGSQTNVNASVVILQVA